MSAQSTSFPSIGNCPQCGGPLRDAVGGICVACLSQAAFLGDDEPLPATPAIPLILGNYETLEELGRGGMGVVYRARQSGLDREVALKVLPVGPLADPEMVRRFRAEAKSVAKLHHPHIVRLHEVGESDGYAYFSMDVIDGGTLGTRIRRHGPMAPKAAAACLGKIAAAISHAHQHQILHRDLKPSNILMDREDEPYVVDFGLAKSVTPQLTEAELTLSHSTVGTPGYLAPEQMSGGSALSPATDVYGLGAILYFTLTGRPPFPAKDLGELLRQVREMDPSPPRLTDPQIPRDLETICLKALEKNPVRRYATAEEFSADLGRFLAGDPILARPLSRLGKAGRWVRRHPGLVTSLAALLVTLIGSTVITSLLWLKARDAAAAEATQRKVGEQELWKSLIITARNERRSGLSGGSERALEAVQRAARIQVTAEVRDEAIAALATPDFAPYRRVSWAGMPHRLIKDPSFHPQLASALTVRESGDRLLLEIENGALRHVLPGPAFQKNEPLSYSGTGNYIWSILNPAAGTNIQAKGTPLVWRERDGTAVPLATAPGVNWILWNHDDSRMILLRRDSAEVRSFDETVIAIAIDPGWRGPAADPAFTRLALGRGRTVQLIDLKDGKTLREMRHPDEVEWCCWNAAGTLVTVGCWNHRLYVWDAETGQQWAECNGHDDRPATQEFVQGGDFLLSAGWDHTCRLWDARSGRPVAVLGGEQYSPIRDSGGLLASLTAWPVITFSTVRLPTILHSPQEPLRPGDALKGVQSVQWSPDGSLLFTSGKPGGINAWETKQWKHLAALPGNRVDVVTLPDQSLCITGDYGLQKLSWERKLDGTFHFGTPQPLGDPDFANYAAGSADGKILAVSVTRPTTEYGRRVEVWQAGELKRAWTMTASWPAVALSPDGNFLATGGTGICRVGLFRLTDGTKLTFPGDAKSRTELDSVDCAFSPDSKLLATQGAQHISVWEIETMTRRFQIPRPTGSLDRLVAFSPNGKTLAAAGTNRDIWLIHSHTGERIATLTPPKPLMLGGIAFSPDGNQLAVAAANRSLIVWNLPALRQALEARGIPTGEL